MTEEKKNKILGRLSDGQVTDIGSYTRSKEYKGYWLSDNDAPLYPYEFLNEIAPLAELKVLMLELRNDGLVTLCPAVDSDGKPNGSGWSLTEKGLEYVVDNSLVVI